MRDSNRNLPQKKVFKKTEKFNKCGRSLTNLIELIQGDTIVCLGVWYR